MGKSALLMLLISATISGCQTTKSTSACDGFKPLHPSLDTSVYILRNDRPFSNEVAAHNRFGKSQGCW